MAHARADRALLLIAGLILALGAPACGKKGPLRLPEDRPIVAAPQPRVRVREGVVTLDFQVPRHRMFPEREAPWVLARILRQAAGASGSPVEAGAILETKGFAFSAPLAWSDRTQPAGSYVYRVEFRDEAHQRRALSGPVSVSWDRTPGVPEGASALGGTRSIALSWAVPATGDAGARYALYRREPPAPSAEAVAPEPVAETRYVDSRVEPGREYCYAIRAVLVVQGVAIEGPAAPEVCARPTDEMPAPARPADAAP